MYTGKLRIPTNRFCFKCHHRVFHSDVKEYVAEGECKGYTVTSVTRICTDGSRPRVTVKSNPYYKKTIKEFIENF